MMFINVYNEPSFSLHKILLMDWSRVEYLWTIVIFLSTLVLTAPIHCRGFTHLILDGLSVRDFLDHLHFWVNYSLTDCKNI